MNIHDHFHYFQESLLLFVPNFSPQDARCASPVEGHNGDVEVGHSSSGWHKEASGRPQCHFKRPSLLRHCYPSSSVQVPSFSANHVKDCLPPCYHSVKAMTKLIKVSDIKILYIRMSFFIDVKWRIF
jgi:hypothetical protein